MRSLSKLLIPSLAVVKNVSLPGASLLPGVPSTDALIFAKRLKSPAPSEPLKSISPRLSPSAIAVFDPTEVPLDLAKVIYDGFSPALFLVIEILELVALVPSIWNVLPNPSGKLLE